MTTDEQFEKWKAQVIHILTNCGKGGFVQDTRLFFDSARKPLEEELAKQKSAYIYDYELLVKRTDEVKRLSEQIQKRDEAARDMEVHNPINHVGVESYYERAKWTFSMQQSEISRLTAEVERLTVERNDAETRVAKTTNQFAETTQRLRADKKALEAEIDGTKGSYLRSQSEVTVLTADNKRLREAMETALGLAATGGRVGTADVLRRALTENR